MIEVLAKRLEKGPAYTHILSGGLIMRINDSREYQLVDEQIFIYDQVHG